jgi:phosphoribosyl 1,2-cyclic phosphodiesterase
MPVPPAPDGPIDTPPVRLWSLGSGSRGNAALIEWDSHRALVDAGFELPELVARIRAADVAPAEIDEVFLTHGHRDHVRGAADGARIYAWRLWGTLGTVWRWRDLRDVPLAPFAPGDVIEAPPFRFHTAGTPHDIDDSSAVVVEVPGAGVRIGYCTDLGHVPSAVASLLVDLDALILESNHDPDLLAAGPYRPDVKERVAGDVGHLSNAQAAALARRVVGPRLRLLALAHISRHNNTPELALRTMRDALGDALAHVELIAAPQDDVAGPWTIPARDTAVRPT